MSVITDTNVAMKFIQPSTEQVVRLKLARDHSKHLKQGYPWIYDQWLVERPKASPGSRAIVRSKEGELLAFGMYDPGSPIAVRVCALIDEKLDDALIEQRLTRAWALRRALFNSSSNVSTNGFRLLNGEGDGLPGLVCDMYGDAAILKLDGEGPTGFWDLEGIAAWLVAHAHAKLVYLKPRAGTDGVDKVLYGTLNQPSVEFKENGVTFRTNIVHGQKSGFFLDQRDNRARIGQLAKDKTVLNMCGYTGGFSVYAGVGGAKHVTTVDLATPAIEDALVNWQLNNLPKERHSGVVADAFEYLEGALQQKESWDLIIVDPPSFAPAEQHVERAKYNYQKLFASALKVLSLEGVIALSSCSSHIPLEMFFEICQAAFSEARLRATILGVYGQPEDHPFPAACRELQYLKFVIFRRA
jgi:23S rRNA (cytosine1962-C5)-methyltransferase